MGMAARAIVWSLATIKGDLAQLTPSMDISPIFIFPPDKVHALSAVGLRMMLNTFVSDSMVLNVRQVHGASGVRGAQIFGKCTRMVAVLTSAKIFLIGSVTMGPVKSGRPPWIMTDSSTSCAIADGGVTP